MLTRPKGWRKIEVDKVVYFWTTARGLMNLVARRQDTGEKFTADRSTYQRFADMHPVGYCEWSETNIIGPAGVAAWLRDRQKWITV